MQVMVSAASQPNVLAAILADANVQHGATVRADLLNVSAVLPTPQSRSLEVRFCALEGARLRQVLKPGDHGAMPVRATLYGLQLDSPQTFNIENALVSVNGTMAITVDQEAKVVVRA